MTGNSFLAEIASTEDVRNIASKSYLGHLENNQLSDILTDIEATIIYEDTCTTVVARYDTVCQTHKMNDCFSCGFTAKSSHYGNHDSCPSHYGSHDSCPSHCGSHQTCSYNGTVCTSGFSNSSCPVTYATQKGVHNPGCTSHKSCQSGFNFDGARAAAAASIMTLSLDLENAVIDDTDGGLGGLNFSTSLMRARAVSCPPYCQVYTDGALSYKVGYNSNHCVAGFCGSFNAADYFNTL